MPYLASLIKYILVGGSAALLNWGVFYISNRSGLPYMLAGLCSFIIATLWNFLLARHFIFRARNHSLLKESTLVYIVSLGGLGIDMLVLYVCVEWLMLPLMLSKIIATAVAFIFNFIARYLGIYKER